MNFGRGKRTLIADRKTKELYKFYKNKYGDKALDKKIFLSVWKRFIDIRMQMLIHLDLEFYMPYRMGSLMIKLGKNANRINKNGNYQFVVDYGATKKKWAELYPDLTPEQIKELKNKPLVPVFNKTTDGRRVYYKWEKVTCNFKNKSAYRFMAIRKWKRMLSNKIKTTKRNTYYE